MRRHTRIYMQEMGYSEGEYIPCEACGIQANDTHHLSGRGMGGSKTKDYIENLMALCRPHHLKAESDRVFNEELKQKHLEFIGGSGKIE